MPLDRIGQEFVREPGAQINTAPMTNIQWRTRPPPPVFPTYQVIMGALSSILPALDPAERAKRAAALMSLQLARERMPLEREQIALQREQIPLQRDLLNKQREYLSTGRIPPGMIVSPTGTLQYATPAQIKQLQDLKARSHGTSDLIRSIKNNQDINVDDNPTPGITQPPPSPTTSPEGREAAPAQPIEGQSVPPRSSYDDTSDELGGGDWSNEEQTPPMFT